jgi:hypothetical protein
MARQKSYVPQGSEEFDVFFGNIVRYVEQKTQGNNPEWTHIPKEDIDALNNMYAAWRAAYEITLKPHTVPETKEKNRVKRAAEKFLRNFVNQFLRYASQVTDMDRDYMRITNPAEKHSPRDEADEGVEFAFRIRNVREVIIDFTVKGSKSRARPYGYDGALVIYALLDKPPMSLEELTRHKLATRTPYTLKFTENERGKTVYVAICWQNNRGQLGPWSAIQSTIVP